MAPLKKLKRLTYKTSKNIFFFGEFLILCKAIYGIEYLSTKFDARAA